MRHRNRSAIRQGFAVLAVLVTAAWAQAGEISAAADASAPFIVKIHADWCGTCTRMDATFDALETALGAQARIVVLDVTDRAAVARSREEAERLGIGEFFESNLSKTGTAAVLDGATREPVMVTKGETDVSVYTAAVVAAQGG
jgi:thiol-disulfide isomerase/thioredoxin